MINRLVHWFDYQVVYRAFNWRFGKKFAENPAMRNAFCDYIMAWGEQHEANIDAKRRATLKLVRKD